MPRLHATLALSLLALAAPAAAAEPPVFVKARLQTGKVAAGAPALVEDVLVGEVPGIRASFVSLGPGGRHAEGRTSAEDKVYQR